VHRQANMAKKAVKPYTSNMQQPFQTV